MDKNFIGELTARVLRNPIKDMRNNNLVPVVVDAYLQGGIKYVSGLKDMFVAADIDKKCINDAIEKIITDLLKAAIS